MKKIILLPAFLICLLCSVKVSAQYCGGSGPSVCSTAGSPLTQEGFYPSENDLPCVVDGQYYDTVIQIRTPPTATQGGSSYTLSKIKITSVTNLPCNMCWQTGDANNEIHRWMKTKNIIEKIGDLLFINSSIISLIEDSVTASLVIDKGPNYKIDSIRVYGNAKISNSFLLHTFWYVVLLCQLSMKKYLFICNKSKKNN